MDDDFQALKEAVVRIGFRKAITRPLVDIPKSRNLELPQILPGISCIIQPHLEVSSQAEVNPRRPKRIESKFGVKRILWVTRYSQVVICEVREEWGLTHVDVA